MMPVVPGAELRRGNSAGALVLAGEEGEPLRFQALNMSEGTLRVLGLLLAVFQNPPPSELVLEEPEATIHPGALGAILDVIHHASRQMQVIVTTHSSDLLDGAKWLTDEHLCMVESGRCLSTQAKIISIGLVASDYQYLPQFDDVNGWDLQHGRRVRWGPHAPYTFATPFFGSATPALAQVIQPELIGYALSFVNSSLEGWKRSPLPPLPPEAPLLDVGRDGISPYLAELVGQALDLAPLYAEPAHFGDPPAEHEMVAHYVVPLLRALGWQPEQIALEWRRIDVALFHRLPRTPEHLAFIVEAKRPNRGLESHLTQARDYLRTQGVERDVVVTDRLRYRLPALCGGSGVRAGGVCEFGAVEGIATWAVRAVAARSIREVGIQPGLVTTKPSI